ncbi:MAG: thioredoxin family protein [Desulfomonile tiedjei]|uniref:Thioredoxin family protein n=1 Tax=Desulfomonile tiedjei TaxID=2358 RepID=A0A9D6Z453_9BACT|nr:thioredoxin family protein [Desulfomonile tiedjei]
MGLKQAIEEIAQSHPDKTDLEIQEILIERLSKKNYIPNSAKRDYGKAFVREFRKFLGQGCEEASGGSLRIVVLGPGCSQCNRLEQTVMQVLSEMTLPASVEHVTDIKEMAKYGFVRTPALVINGKVITMGAVPSAKRVKEWLMEANGVQSAR